MDGISGKVALITGSSRGIGKAIAQKLAHAGADIAINFRNDRGSSRAKAEALQVEIKRNNCRSILIQSDISKKDSVKAMIQAVSDGLGKLDYLILNAARAPFKPIEKLFERELKQLVETNYLGNIFCIQQAIPLLEKNHGKIIFLSSLGSRFFNPSYPLGSMKAAMEAVVRDCAESLREKNISVNAVCGGIVKTDSFKVYRQYWDHLEKLPDDLVVETSEIADVVAFLCSPFSKGINGQTIIVDKGLSSTLIRQ